MRIRTIVSLIALTGLVAAVGVGIQPSAHASRRTGEKVDVKLLVELGKGEEGAPTSVKEIMDAISSIGSGPETRWAVDSFFDVSYVSNIGSSGSDGVRDVTPDSFFDITYTAVDSFFDIEYRIDSPTVDIELVALSLRARVEDPDDPEGLIRAIRKAVGTRGTVHHGHVTVLK